MSTFQRMRSPREGSRRRRRTAGQSGVTIIELMIAVLVFGVVASGVAVAMGTGLNTIRNNRNRSVAANLAAKRMDEIRVMANKNFASMSPGQETFVYTNIDSVDYTLTQDTEWVPQDSSTSACLSPTGSIPAFLRVTLRVTWPNMSGARAVQSQTILSPPVGAYDPNSGHIAVKVLDAEGAPLAGHQVTVTGPSGNTSQTTTSDGCAFFAYLAPGTYTASMNSSGYVDRQGVTNPTQLAGVTVGTTTALQFDYDEAATLELTLGQDSNYVFGPGSNSIPVMVANTGLLPTGVKAFPATGSSRTITNLFPYPSGYEVWVGSCADNDPLSYTNASRLRVDVSPGATTAATVPMKLVEVKVFDNSGVQQGGRSVRARHAADPNSCSTPSPWAYSFVLGNTSSSDPKVLNVALPYGTWEFRANSPFYNWGPTNAALDPNSPDPFAVEVWQP